MKLMLSGEGPTDIGTTRLISGGAEFVPGPMTEIIDWLVDDQLQFSPLELDEQGAQCVRHLTEGELAYAKVPPRPRLLPGSVRAKGEAGTTAHAYALGCLARATAAAAQEPVVAVLFRDSDGTRSAPKGLWQGKVDAIEQGFELARFDAGVAMVPRPKSEAWLLCALKPNPYQHCTALELSPGNDRSPNALKPQLATQMNVVDPTGDEQADWVRTKLVDPTRIDMPSFNVFAARLKDVLTQASAPGWLPPA
jgi:hypothetical protein